MIRREFCFILCMVIGGLIAFAIGVGSASFTDPLRPPHSYISWQTQLLSDKGQVVGTWRVVSFRTRTSTYCDSQWRVEREYLCRTNPRARQEILLKKDPPPLLSHERADWPACLSPHSRPVVDTFIYFTFGWPFQCLRYDSPRITRDSYDARPIYRPRTGKLEINVPLLSIPVVVHSTSSGIGLRQLA